MFLEMGLVSVILFSLVTNPFFPETHSGSDSLISHQYFEKYSQKVVLPVMINPSNAFEQLSLFCKIINGKSVQPSFYRQLPFHEIWT